MHGQSFVTGMAITHSEMVDICVSACEHGFDAEFCYCVSYQQQHDNNRYTKLNGYNPFQ